MTNPRHIAVIDIGKTNAKLALVDLETLTEIDVVTRSNTVLPGPPWPHFDVEGHWGFLLDALARFHTVHGVDAISVTTHGACCALLNTAGELAAPILDYEHPIPANIAAEYDTLRPPFSETGSPRLSGGLSIGAQLHWQFSVQPDLRDRVATIVTYPQYWGHRLTGIAASDLTSLGCHTDLWAPREGQFSSLPARLGIEDKIAPVRQPAEMLGPILPEIAARTGLPAQTPVTVGIHDSNASLYPHLLTQEGAFSVVSTGTWVIAMALAGDHVPLDPARDTLINVNARGGAVPSARFMGGREYEVIRAGHDPAITDEDIDAILSANTLLLPSVDPSTGPFQGRAKRWQGLEPPAGSGTRMVALSFYLALMTETCLRLTGARGPIIVEGPFAGNWPFMAMLHSASGRPVLHCRSKTGTSIGAALLTGNSPALDVPIAIAPPSDVTKWRAYAQEWMAVCARD